MAFLKVFVKCDGMSLQIDTGDAESSYQEVGPRRPNPEGLHVTAHYRQRTQVERAANAGEPVSRAADHRGA